MGASVLDVEQGRILQNSRLQMPCILDLMCLNFPNSLKWRKFCSLQSMHLSKFGRLTVDRQNMLAIAVTLHGTLPASIRKSRYFLKNVTFSSCVALDLTQQQIWRYGKSSKSVATL